MPPEPVQVRSFGRGRLLDEYGAAVDRNGRVDWQACNDLAAVAGISAHVDAPTSQKRGRDRLAGRRGPLAVSIQWMPAGRILKDVHATGHDVGIRASSSQ